MSSAVIQWRETVLDEWIDYNQHLSEGYYVLVFGHATDAVMEYVGLGAEYRAQADASLFTIEAHVRYLDQIPASTDLEVRSTVIGSTPKLLRIWHEMWALGSLRATEEVLGVHVDTISNRSKPFPDDVTRRIEALLVDPPPDAGGAIALRSA
jgi:acyl-CoA thioester hydrolase